MGDVYISYSELGEIETNLTGIVAEFENAGRSSDDLAAAIDDPYGRHELRNAAREFEERWDGKRGELAEDLGKILERVTGILDGFREGDDELAIALEPEE
ncbi:flagellar protein FlgN [Microbacterium suaedae]|uniref:flagellar protein FlgN n=1 Tax=Microbacterium suaedae TaxID=2067813 RepID=UPI000DA224F3|nr:flagellar protein FlgN [Microbacterium suaedae]